MLRALGGLCLLVILASGVVRAESGKEPILRLGANNLPPVPPEIHTIRRDYYDCKGIVANWYLDVLKREFQFLEQSHKLQSPALVSCALALQHDVPLADGKYVINLFDNDEHRRQCIHDGKCRFARNVTLYARQNALQRSYFLTDYQSERFFQDCIDAGGKLHRGVSCARLTF